ncbi:MAG: PDZ domain-containing protein [Desulfobulbaceae bacterium]|nr:PDZ domain-containing protein [Desulfobulbaceae bacterium]
MAKIYRTGFLLIASAVIVFAGVDVFYKVLRLRWAETVVVPAAGGGAARPMQPQRRQTGANPAGDQVILARNLFGSVEAAPEGTTELADVGELQETTLDLILLGTIDSDGSAKCAIIVDGKTRDQDIYREGDSVQQALVKKILRGRVVLNLRGRDEVLSMDDDNAPPPVEPAAAKIGRTDFTVRPVPTRPVPDAPVQVTSIVLARSDVERVMSDFKNLQGEVLTRPHFSGGKVDGLMLMEIKEGSFLRELGLLKNDIVESVNGKPVTSLDETAALYSSLMAGEPVAMQFKRGGTRQTINYTLKE